MQNHIKVYREFYGIGDQDATPSCSICGLNNGVQIHHIHSRGLKTFKYEGKQHGINDILNLIALCRDHHSDAHGGGLSKEFLLKTNEISILNHG